MDFWAVPILLLLISPAILGIGGACGWLLATVYSFVRWKSSAVRDPETDAKSQEEPSRVTVAAMLGCCFATTTYLVAQDQIISIGFTFLILTSVFLSSGTLIYGILHFLSKRAR
jgi:hypothetical protein